MKILLNFAHPLSEKAKSQIKELEGEFKEIIVPCQLDFNSKSLSAQIADIEAGNHDVLLMKADLVIAPALSAGAYLLAQDHLVSSSESKPRLVWLKRDVGPPPQQFILGGIE